MAVVSPFTTRPVISGTFGVVTSTHWLASQTGMTILEKGGNAFDAAVAAGLVLQVVEPHMNGAGGDAVMLIQRARAAMPRVICGQGVAPAKATIAHYRREGLDLVPGTGLLAAVVPGAFDAWMLMARDHGTMTLARCIHDRGPGGEALDRLGDEAFVKRRARRLDLLLAIGAGA